MGAALAEYLLLAGLMAAGLNLGVATAVAAEVLILTRFLIADRWVFHHARPNLDRLLRYHGACVGSFVAYWLVINGTASWLGLPKEIGFVLGTGASFGSSLITNFLWVWRKPPALDPATQPPT